MVRNDEPCEEEDATVVAIARCGGDDGVGDNVDVVVVDRSPVEVGLDVDARHCFARAAEALRTWFGITPLHTHEEASTKRHLRRSVGRSLEAN